MLLRRHKGALRRLIVLLAIMAVVLSGARPHSHMHDGHLALHADMICGHHQDAEAADDHDGDADHDHHPAPAGGADHDCCCCLGCTPSFAATAPDMPVLRVPQRLAFAVPFIAPADHLPNGRTQRLSRARDPPSGLV